MQGEGRSADENGSGEARASVNTSGTGVKRQDALKLNR